MFKTKKFKLFLLLVGISGLFWRMPSMPGIAQDNYCQVKQNNRKLPTSIRASKLNAQIEWAMKEANLKGQVESIVWADGVQIYNYRNGQPKIFAPLANLYPVENLDDKLYLMTDKLIGNHDQVEDSPAWEFFDGQRFIAQDKKAIEGAEQTDAPWLAVRTKKHYILRIETRGGKAPDCQFEGLLGVPYQTLYVIIKSDSPQASQQSIFE